MSEICLDCLNKLNGTNEPRWHYIFSEEPDLCEECGERKPVVVVARSTYYIRKFRFIIHPVIVFIRVLMLPYLLCKRRKGI